MNKEIENLKRVLSHADAKHTEEDVARSVMGRITQRVATGDDRQEATYDEILDIIDGHISALNVLSDVIELAVDFNFGQHPGLWVHHSNEVHAQFCGDDRWAVRVGCHALGSDKLFMLEPSPSHRDEDFLAKYRFDRDTAMRLARHIVEGKFTGYENDPTPAGLERMGI